LETQKGGLGKVRVMKKNDNKKMRGEGGKAIRAFYRYFKQLHVNIPFFKALEHMPTYAKSMIGFAYE